MLKQKIKRLLKEVDSIYEFTPKIKSKSKELLLDLTNVKEFYFEFDKSGINVHINSNTTLTNFISSVNAFTLHKYVDCSENVRVFLELLSVLYKNNVFDSILSDKSDKVLSRLEIIYNLCIGFKCININQNIFVRTSSRQSTQEYTTRYYLPDEEEDCYIDEESPSIKKVTHVNVDDSKIRLKITLLHTKDNDILYKQLNNIYNKYKNTLVDSNKSILDSKIRMLKSNDNKFKIDSKARLTLPISKISHNSKQNNIYNTNIVTRALDTLIFKDKGKLINYLEYWLNSTKQFDELNIPFKTGILLQGKPGTGKSSLSYSIAGLVFAQKIYHFDTNFIQNEGVNAIYKMIRESSVPNLRTVIIFDEFEKTISHLSEKEIADFCELLDSPSSPSNCIFIAITNDKSKIPEVLTRTGRFDLDLTLDYFDKDDVIEYLTSKIYLLK